MHIPYIRGRVALQAHVGLPAGTVEEELGRAGFSGGYAHLYRTEPPTGWTRIEGPLRPRAYDLEALPAVQPPLRTPVLFNEDVRLSMLRIADPMPHFFRNADADELVFVHAGAGRIETDFGPLAYEAGDYLRLPRGTTYRLHPTSASFLLLLEARGEIDLPDRGPLGQHALFDPALLKVPTPGERSSLGADARGEWEVRVLRAGEITSIYYPFCPLNTVGWKGTCAPIQLNVRDIRPVLSDRYHLPPSAHASFVMPGAVVCTFAPRPLETGDAAALKVPFYHSNIDYDEVLFYHSGEFFSRTGIRPGMLTLHPQGIHHGPQPGAAERAKDARRTEEVAVMIDTRRPLEITTELRGVEHADYWQSWQRRGV